MSSYRIKLPVTAIYDVELSSNDVSRIIRDEMREIVKPWDHIVEYRGQMRFYKEGYGSHNIGEEYGPEVPIEVLDKLNMLRNAERYFYKKANP